MGEDVCVHFLSNFQNNLTLDNSFLKNLDGICFFKFFLHGGNLGTRHLFYRLLRHDSLTFSSVCTFATGTSLTTSCAMVTGTTLSNVCTCQCGTSTIFCTVWLCILLFPMESAIILLLQNFGALARMCDGPTQGELHELLGRCHL